MSASHTLMSLARKGNVIGWVTDYLIGGYTACRIPLIRSANGNGNRIPLNGIPFNGILLNGIPFNGIPFPFISVMAFLPASVNCQKR